MTCKIEYDADGFPISFECGSRKPKDHQCDALGETKEIRDGMGGTVYSATCSKCGAPAYDFREIWG